MNIEQAAKELDGGEYGNEGSKDLFGRMKDAGLVALFGASDDNVEIRGAVDDEIGAFQGVTLDFTSAGLLKSECDEGEECPYFKKLLDDAKPVEALWCDEEDFSWTFRTTIPHATFVINEDGEPFCRGIVFALRAV